MRSSFVLGLLGVLAGCGTNDSMSVDAASDAPALGTDGGDGAPASLDGGSDSGASLGGRLFVSMSSSAPAVWENVDSITKDSVPSFTLADPSVASGTRAMLLAKNNRWFLGTAQPSGLLVAFDSADKLTAGASPSAKIPASSLVATAPAFQQVDALTWDASTDALWITNGTSGVEMFTGAGSITSASKAQAAFTRSGVMTLYGGFAYDPIGARAFLGVVGNINVAGLQAWNGAVNATGTPSPSYTLDAMEAQPAAIHKDRLYASATGGIAVWNAISGVSSAKAPDFTMGAKSGIPSMPRWMTVNDADVLIACVGTSGVLVWTNASSLTGETLPTQIIPANYLANPRKAVIGAVTGRLYVLDDVGVAIFSNPTTSPTFEVRISKGIAKPLDFAVLE